MKSTRSNGTKRKLGFDGISSEMAPAQSPPMPPPRSGYCYGPALGVDSVIGQGRGHGQTFGQGQVHGMRFGIGLGHGHGQRLDQGQGQGPGQYLGQGSVVTEGQGLDLPIPMESDDNDAEEVYPVPFDENAMDI